MQIWTDCDREGEAIGFDIIEVLNSLGGIPCLLLTLYKAELLVQVSESKRLLGFELLADSNTPKGVELLA